MSSGRHIVFFAWRDLANKDAGGSELLVDRLAQGLTERGDRVTLLCGGAVGERPYEVLRSGGTYTQFARAPFAVRRHLRDCDLIVEVCNGMPYLAPLWTKRPVVCLVNHVHTELWQLRFPPPVAALGRLTESAVMPWVHRDNLFLTVSASTFAALREIGVDTERIRLICNGVEPGPPPAPRSPEPLFLALGRLAGYKRIDVLLRLWDRVRHVTGGRLVIAGDGPERERLQSMAGPGVEFTGRVSEEEKHRLLSAAWLLLHPASIEGWGIVVAEAAVRGTPAIGFSVPGLKDSVAHNETGLLVRTEGEFASAWASLAIDDRKRHSMGRAARERALQLHWSAAVDGFSLVADEALARARVASQGSVNQARASQARASQNRASQNPASQARASQSRADAGADEAVVADAVGYLAQPSGPAPPEPM
ncbi:MAG TPA: glycosyltransferase family 4 protein [Streptosporangiaceae bacterium]|nr:glycosyltransferase family 4 protein [Streptosporangiaceae bacterium]